MYNLEIFNRKVHDSLPGFPASPAKRRIFLLTADRAAAIIIKFVKTAPRGPCFGERSTRMPVMGL